MGVPEKRGGARRRRHNMPYRTAVIDVTQRRRAEQSRRESEARPALITDNVPVLVSYVDADRRYVFNNAAYERRFGHSRDDIHAPQLLEVLGEEAYDAVRHHVDTVLAGEEVHFEAAPPYRDAVTRYVAASYIPHRDPAGVPGFFALINDLTERRHVERALVEERIFVSAMLETAGALVVVIDRHGHIVHFNHECERGTGYHRDEVEDKHFDSTRTICWSVCGCATGPTPSRRRTGSTSRRGRNVWRC